MKKFDPNAACPSNDHFFGFPYSVEEASTVLVSVPWDVTTSYKPGAAKGPASIRKASCQLDFFDYEVPFAWESRIATLDSNLCAGVELSSSQIRPMASRIIDHAENFSFDPNDDLDNENRKDDLLIVNQACEMLNEWVFDTCQDLLNQHKRIGIVGGDHSVPLGFLKALSQKYSQFGILHIDAHADLREAYEGFTYSHASIFYNALKIEQIQNLVQVGTRDLCPAEAEIIQTCPNRIASFPDILLQKRRFEGESWSQLCKEIIEKLPQKVYISFDIDGLEPSLCPHTGTPVPGGLSFAQVRYLLSQLRNSGKEIIGFDLCEVAPDLDNPKEEYDGNVGARILYMLCLCLKPLA
ncbi:MAG: agmatinase family protein [Bacteroidales bacterium]